MLSMHYPFNIYNDSLFVPILHIKQQRLRKKSVIKGQVINLKQNLYSSKACAILHQLPDKKNHVLKSNTQ